MVVAAILTLALSGVLLLHFVEPTLPITWSYAHLGRSRWLLGLAGVVAIGLPIVFHRFTALSTGSVRPTGIEHPTGHAPVGALPRRWASIGCFLLFLGLLCASILAPSPWMSMDSDIFLTKVTRGEGDVARWHLLLIIYQRAAALVGDFVQPIHVILGINSLLASVAIASLIGSARCLTQNRVEALALILLACTTFGVVQICVGHSDIYTMPLAGVALYCWLSLETIRGRCHPAWPLALAGIGPFVYLGLVLLAPSALLIIVREWARPDGRRRCIVAVAVAIALAGAATIPVFGAPFAFMAYFDALQALPAAGLGYNRSGYNVPLVRMVHPDHLAVLGHLMLLIDPVGWILLLTCGPRLLARRASLKLRTEAVFLALLVLPYSAFMIVMDPLWGAYADWNLYSYGAVGTCLLGGFAFVHWGRENTRLFGALLGLALAVSTVHLMAKFHSMDIERERHLTESPDNLRPYRN